MENISGNSFCFGAIYGFIAAGIVGIITNRMREARLKMSYKDRTYDRFPNALHTNLTASGVVRTSWQEILIHRTLSIVLIVFIALALVGAFFIIL